MLTSLGEGGGLRFYGRLIVGSIQTSAIVDNGSNTGSYRTQNS